MKKKVISTEKVLKPKINNPKLTKEILVTDENKKKIKMYSIVERPLTLFLNEQEIVTMMTICDYPKYLAIGYLLNQTSLSGAIWRHRTTFHGSKVESSLNGEHPHLRIIVVDFLPFECYLLISIFIFKRIAKLQLNLPFKDLS